MTRPPCQLCGSPSQAFYKDPRTQVDYSHCPICDFRFMDENYRLNPSEELQRYHLHQNDIHDPKFQKFVQPLLDMVKSRIPQGAHGLDFGAGPQSVSSYLLEQSGYRMSLYDPFFHKDRAVFERTYDFIIAVEVIEHLYHPENELHRLRRLVRPGGGLGFMTHIYSEDIDFADWYYRRDPTHVGFYSRRTFQWIHEKFSFRELHLNNRVAWLSV